MQHQPKRYASTGQYGSDSRVADKFVIRLPDGWRDQLADRARERRISMNTVCLGALDKELFGSENEWVPRPGLPVFHEDEPAIIDDVLIRAGKFFARIRTEETSGQIVPCEGLRPFTITALTDVGGQ